MQRRDFVTYSGIAAVGTWFLPSIVSGSINEESELLVKAPSTAKFVWSDNEGIGRNLYTNFRKSFSINGKIETAIINLFVDSSYQIFVNGEFVNQGPLRFDPRFPVYDSIDLKPFLKEGENVIAVKANYFGMKTYKSIANRAGFIAWGEIKSGSKTINLDTNAQNWKCAVAQELGSYVQKLSFALNPTEILEQEKESKNWKLSGFDELKWKQPVLISKQDSWGEFSKRDLPFISGNEIEINKVLHTYPLEPKEDYYSFSLSLPNLAGDEYNSYGNGHYIAFQTWIYSEKDQTVKIGHFWGENWINGKPLKSVGSKIYSMRLVSELKLNKGWNSFFGKVGPYSDLLNHYFTIPKNKGITFSAEKSLNNTKTIFKRTPIVSSAEFEKNILPKTLPFEQDETLKEVGGWVSITSKEKAQNPCFETSWDMYGEQIEILTPQDLKGYIFKKEIYQDGFSITFDLGKMHLSYPKIKIEGVTGATIDFTYGEQLCDDKAHILHVFNYLPGDRIICNQDTLDWMPSHPRGIRYLKLTIRNLIKDIKVTDFKIISANLDLPTKGSFNCSDNLLNAVWTMCEKTQKSNMEDAYVDCSGRERGMYLRDTIIQYYNNLALFGDHKLMRRCMELYLQSPDETGKVRAVYPNVGNYTISDFCLNLMEGLRGYFDYTNDSELITKYWDAIMGNINWFNKLSDEREDGLLDADWPKKQKTNAHYGGFHGDLGIVKGSMDINGVHCVFTLTYLIALKDTIYLAKKIDKKIDAESLQKRVDKLTTSIQKFWDDLKNAFVDKLGGKTYSPHAGLFAIRAGIATDTQFEKIKIHVKQKLAYIFANGYNPDEGVYVSPSYMYYIFDGLYKAKMPEIAENLMRQGWGWCLYNGFTTVPEYFDNNPYNSMCHAWSASPVYYLSKNVLGINFPKSPDLNFVEINVNSSSISFAEGKYPHPKGTIDVKWHTENGKRVFDYAKAPEGVEIIING
ncbi:MAG: hypothetical protein EAZ53_13925 [Bacteroidetes bacterium]|nr:MAG: hypothetical protein EAZ53_13925 [Bacteroidota bacterium]